jgi:ribosomal protein S18 acetylase RimI-like enzyme
MPADNAFEVEQCNVADLAELREALLDVYAAANAVRRDHPFFQPDAFWTRLVERHALTEGFELVLGRLDGVAIGFAYGSPRRDPVDIWAMVRKTLPDVAVPSDTEPIYVLREIAVDPRFQGRGYGRRLHDTLLSGRPERIAQLLVLPDNASAKRAYYSWGWRDIGPRQPLPESPIGDAMVKVLH